MDKKTRALINELSAKRKNSLTRHLYVVYWHMYEWSRKKWAEDGWSDITVDHIKLISIIADGERMNNAELAKKAGVTKQAMSQMVNLMEKRGVLVVEQDPGDSRAKLISLSKYGVEFTVYFSSCSDELVKHYTKMIGSQKAKLLLELAGELANGIMEAEPSSKFLPTLAQSKKAY
jgi:DNA-binding MarR family transcriptional regulator